MHIARIRNGALLISVGIVSLLNTTGHLSWMVWSRIFSLWPIVLVAIGIELLFKRTRLSFLALLSPLLFIVAILGPALFLDKDIYGIHRTEEAYLWSQDLDSTLTKATTSIHLRAGDLKLSSGTDKLISAELDYCDIKPIATYELRELDSSATIEIKDSERSHWGWSWNKMWSWGECEKKNWEIKLTHRIPMDLRVYTKAGQADLDLSDLKVNSFDLDAKASSAEIKIGDLVNEVTGKIDAKASKLSISFPEDMGLKIENHAKLSTTSFSYLSLKATEEGYETPDFENVSRKLTLYLEGSVIKLKINQYKPLEGI